jgi:hypothetical protein
MAPILSQNPLESSQMRTGYKDTRTGRKLAQRGLSLRAVAAASGVGPADVYNYCTGRRNRIGRDRRRALRQYLVQLGVVPPAKKRVPKCRMCGTEYPTTRRVPSRIMAG